MSTPIYGSHSFTNTPDVNGTLVMLNGGGNDKMTSGLYSSIPSFGNTGHLYIATDQNIIYRDTGTAWVPLTSAFSIKNFYSGSIGILTGGSSIDASTTVTISQGSQIMSQSITPTSTSSNIIINYSAPVGVSTLGRGTVIALFAGNTFLTATEAWFPSVSGFLSSSDVNGARQASIHFVHQPGTTSSITYSMRIGITAGSGIWYLGRGSDGAHDFGGNNNTTWSITEI